MCGVVASGWHYQPQDTNVRREQATKHGLKGMGQRIASQRTEFLAV